MPRKKSVPIEEPSYEVECINAARVTTLAQWEYNIKWGGYSEDDNSWEPEANLGGCGRMMAEFWQQVGPDNQNRVKHFKIGYEVTPSTLWMNRQRDSYQKSQKKKSREHKRNPARDKDMHRGREASHRSAGSLTTGGADKPSSKYSDDSDDDDIPLSQVFTEHKAQAPTAKVAGATSNVDDLQASSSKRKLDDELSSELPNKRPKATITDKAPMMSIQTDIATSNMDNLNRSPPPSPQRKSLFSDGSESEDDPLTSKPSTAASRPAELQPAQPQQTKPTVQPSAPSESQSKGKSKVPLHIQRRQNPLVKPMALPFLDTNMGGITTKHRIVLQGSAKSTSPSTPRNTTTAVAGSSPAGFQDSPDIPQSAVATPDLDANVWLKENIMSKEELARVAPNTSRPSSTEPSSTISAVPHFPHFSKRWRWTGQLAVGDNESGFAEPVGSIVVADNTPLDRNAGNISFEALLPSHVDTICLRHQYSFSALRMVLCNFRLSQFAVMTADRSDDENSFDDVVSYMTRHELFSQSPLTISDIEAATLFVFPSNCLDSLNVPAKVRQGKGLVVAVGFKVFVSPKTILGGSTLTYTDYWKSGSNDNPGPEMRSSHCIRAFQALKFPENLFQRLTNKQCTIFTTPSDRDLPGHDSLALVSLLEHSPGCRIVPLLTGNARFIFIHVSSWDMLHKLPGLVDRRLRRPDVQFYTYGSDPSVERKRWGVHEVFPLGGIVTFTPRAIVEDPPGVEQLIAKLDQHPLWGCYVLPSVIPMLCEIAAENESPYDGKSGIEALCSILIPIEKGQIALTWQPPHRVAQDANSGVRRIDWMTDQARLSELQGDDLVLECQKRFQRHQDRSEKDVEAQIVNDLLMMQSELRGDYRRFVIITDSTGPSNTSKEAAASTSVSKADIKDGFELTHVKDFVFNDDYFAGDGA